MGDESKRRTGSGRWSKKKIYLTAGIGGAIAAVCAAVLIPVLTKHTGGSGQDGDNTAYVQSVSAWMGAGDAGTINRYSGLVDSQDTWSVTLEQDQQVKDIFVTQGQEVRKGDRLFTYNTEKLQSDLDQANIDLERMQNEKSSISDTISQLTKEKKSAASADQADYTIQIQEQQLALKQKNLDIQSKQLDVSKLNENIKNSTVTSQIDGVVKSVGSQDQSQEAVYDGSGTSGAFITIIKTGDLRIKGSVNEQNVADLTEGAPVIVHSRVSDQQTWHGVIEKVDTDQAGQAGDDGSANAGSDDGSGQNSSTNYTFYVKLDDSKGLMLGQHVFVEPDQGQDSAGRQGLWIGEYLIDMTDPDHPAVWIDKNGKLARQQISLGSHDEDLMEYEVTQGLSADDQIAAADPSLEEGMKTAPMSQEGEEGDQAEDGAEQVNENNQEGGGSQP